MMNDLMINVNDDVNLIYELTTMLATMMMQLNDLRRTNDAEMND